MNIGKLYQTKKYYWLLYPSKDIAPATTDARETPFGSIPAATAAAYLSKKYNCNVSYISANSIFCLLEQDKKFLKILTTNGEVGWIYLVDWYKDDIEEVTKS